MAQGTILGCSICVEMGGACPTCRARSLVGYEVGGCRLTSVIGVGGQGAVYAATTNIGAWVAVKVLHPEFAASPMACARFQREPALANAVAAVHDGAVPIFFAGTAPTGAPFHGTRYFVMPLLFGRSLEDRLAEGPLTWGAAVELGKRCADVLAAGHAVGVVNRDVKPSNVFLTRDQSVKMLDWGIARSAAMTGPALTVDGMLLGTLDFMSPEGAQGRVVDERADVFSLALMLVAAMSGRPPRGAGPTLAILARAAFQALPPVATMVPGLPGPVAEVLDAGLAFDPHARPSAKAFQHALVAVRRHVRLGLAKTWPDRPNPARGRPLIA